MNSRKNYIPLKLPTSSEQLLALYLYFMLFPTKWYIFKSESVSNTVEAKSLDYIIRHVYHVLWHFQYSMTVKF